MFRGVLRFLKFPLQKKKLFVGGQKKDGGGNKEGYIQDFAKTAAAAAILQLCPERLPNMSGGGFEFLCLTVLLQWPVMRYSIDPSFSRIKDCHEMHYQAQ
jgi:hypothetical protein